VNSNTNDLKPCAGVKILGLTLMVTLALGTAPLRAGIFLMDNMSNPAYTVFSFNSSDSLTNPDDISSAGFTAHPSGGNSGPRLEVFHDHDVDRDGNGAPLNGNGSVFIQSFLVDQSTTYTPSINGTILDISFSLDVLFPVSNSSTKFEQLFFVLSDTAGGGFGGFTNIVGQAGWQTITVSGLTNADFLGRNFNGPLALSAGFGFVSQGDVTGGFDNLAMQVDNFQVSVNSITAVPEPSSLLSCAALAVCGLVRRFYGMGKKRVKC
jgi:hypothetical protein